jgi:hypothetical protein
MRLTLTNVISYLRNPYSYRRVRDRAHWWIRDWVGNKYEIVYDETSVIAELRDSPENVKEMVDLLNAEYRVGIADTFAVFEHEKVIDENT